MTRRNRTTNASTAQTAAAPRVPAPPQAFQPRLDLRRRLTPVLLNLLGAVLLSIALAPFDVWWVAYVALVPWAMSLTGSRHDRWSLLCAWGGGLVFALANLYWLSWITMVGYVSLAVYVSLYWLAAGAAVRAASRRNWPMWLVLPVTWVALEYVRAVLVSGFPWLLVGHTQYRQLRLIQSADWGGAYAVSFFVAMVNGAIVDLLCSPLFVRRGTGGRISRRMLAAGAAVLLVGAGMLAYGQWRLSQQPTQEGPVVALVQHAYPITLGGRGASSHEIFQSFQGSTETLMGSGVDLVVWPETMLPQGMNPQVLETDLDALGHARLRAMGRQLLGPDALLPKYTDEDIRDNLKQMIDTGYSHRERLPLRRYAELMAELSGRLGAPILAGGGTIVPQEDPRYPNEHYVPRNSAMWFEASPMAYQRYDKVQLVPFGEYVPFKYGWPALHRALRWFVPDVMDQLDPGREDTTFVLQRPGGSWRLVTPICYEGIFPSRSRELVMRGGVKSAELIVNMSNDGWFIRQRAGQAPQASTELAQHLAQYCFRAVETRTPVVRAVNTGISASIDSSGAIAAVVRQKVGDRWQEGLAVGTLVLDGKTDHEGHFLQGHGPKVLVDGRISRYSLAGDVFAQGTCIAAAAALVLLLDPRRLAGRLRRRAKKGQR